MIRHIHNFDSELRGFPNFAQCNAPESALRINLVALSQVGRNDRLFLALNDSF